MTSPVISTEPLGFPWATADPFLFCVHHNDAYPEGNDKLGPRASLTGRDIGQDFSGRDGWSMYHGDVVPGFPQHPHRGFETVTLVRSGYIDHSDSLGATARFGRGDAQWLTAGAGIVHCEMFPLLEETKPNPVELFQIWLNLPGEDKLVAPHFAMLWGEDIPQRVFTDDAGRVTRVTVVAGQLDGSRAPSPPPRSWASRSDTDVAIWSIRLSAGAKWMLPCAAGSATVRNLYFFAGPSVKIGEHQQKSHAGIEVKASIDLEIQAGDGECEILLLQGRPIGEPVAQYGPFVMNTRAEIEQAIADYRRTQFGGWPWPVNDPVHPRGEGRFAKHADGEVERRDR
ncbi:MAG: pirin family protein [Vicinamibacteria bacterium]|nr:pirin family protein [Vicinamibacteria bacterium]